LRLDALEAPLYLMGESYGVTRASLVAEALTRRRTKVAGVILLSGGFPMEEDVPAPTRTALTLPIWTAAAHHNKKLVADLQHMPIEDAIKASLAFAERDYAVALARGDSLPADERANIAAQLSRFTGLGDSQVNAATLRVTTEQMSTTLLGSDQMVGRYDSRAVGPADKSGGPYDPTKDPSLKDILDAASVLRYLREELGYKSDLNYQGPFGGAYPPPTAFRGDWMSVRWNFRGPTSKGLVDALANDPDLRVFHACGYYDMPGGCYASDYAARHVATALQPRVTSRVYAGGHATYTDDGARRQLQADVVRFIQSGSRR
jgi:carboxypeptidase C (cathepsin A)